MERTGVIIVAGGSGRRMGTARPKQFLLLGTEPILTRTINTFASALPGATLVVVLPEEHIGFWHNLSARFEVAKHTVVVGGEQRFHSVKNGLAALPDDTELIAIHDGVRPLVSAELIHRTLAAATEHGAAIPVIPPADSFRQLDEPATAPADSPYLPNGAVTQSIDTHQNNTIDSHPLDRSRLRAVQTPQIFRADLLRRAYQTEFSPTFTDDASVVEQLQSNLFLCEGDRLNIKITTLEDMLFAEAILEAAAQAQTDEHIEAKEPPIPDTTESNRCKCHGNKL